MRLSLVVPCYNEALCVRRFWEAVRALALPCETEFVFVDDGSRDGTLAALRTLAREDATVRYISFSRNFGKEAALLAGLRKATGERVVTLDVDLQHPVALLPEMLVTLDGGAYDCVAARRTDRAGEPWLRSQCAKAFYEILNQLSEVQVRGGETDYRMMTRQVVDAVLALPEVNRFTKGIYAWVGFRTKWLEFGNVERAAGETKWSFWGLVRYSLQGITAFSVAPLQLASVAGILSCVAALLYLTYVIFVTLIMGNPVSGYSTQVCLTLFFGGLQLFSIGILGNYLAKTYLETKHRPLYLIQEEH